MPIPTELDRVIGKLRRLAALAPDGKRVFGFATILQEVADDLATVQLREKGESNMREPQAELLADLFQQLELALYGKFGNTWEVQQMRRVEAVLQRAVQAGLQPAQATIPRLQALVQRWRDEVDRREGDDKGEYVDACIDTFNQCADDLAAALRAAIPAPREPQTQEHEEDLSRVGPLTAGAAATGSTAEDQSGAVTAAERTDEC